MNPMNHPISLSHLQYNNLFVSQITDYSSRLKNGESKRAFEKMEVKNAIEQLGFDSEIGYKKTGQPYLTNHPEVYISISHSNGWIAVCISDTPVGIDIETVNPLILRGTDYFVNERERKYLENLKHLHLIWGAKEAFYKWKEGQISDLKNEVTICDISADKTLQVQFESNIYTLNYVQENDITLVLISN